LSASTPIPTAPGAPVPAIRLEGVAKAFRQGFWMRPVEAVKRVSLEVPAGSLFGYLGHNGAGKTTTIRMLLGLVAPSRGRVAVWGGAPGDPRVRRRVGYLPEQPNFYLDLTAREFLGFHADLCGLAGDARRHRIGELLERVGLTGVEGVRLGRFSKGMLQRIGLAQALVGDPDLLVLDEPMSGLDPVGRKEVRDLMVDLGRRGKTVFFSTHVLSDAEAVCDQVAILVRGEVRSVGALADLLKPRVTEVEITAAGLPPDFRAGGVDAPVADGALRVRVPESARDDLVRAVLAAGGRVTAVTPYRETLENLFMHELSAVERAG
jgi:ABC-2 type transport system ATP-binding protein